MHKKQNSMVLLSIIWLQKCIVETDYGVFRLPLSFRRKLAFGSNALRRWSPFFYESGGFIPLRELHVCQISILTLINLVSLQAEIEDRPTDF